MVKRLLILFLLIPVLAYSQQVKDISGTPHEVREAGNITFVTELNYSGAEKIYPVDGTTVIYKGSKSYGDIVASGVVGGSLYCAEFQAVYDKWTTKPHADTAAIFNTMVETLVDGGVWDSLDIFPFFAVHTNDDGEALIDWIHPDSTLTAVNSPTFTPYEGFTGDGSTSYINTNWNPSTDAQNYTLNDGLVTAYLRLNIQSEYNIGSDDGTNRIDIKLRNTSNQYWARINTGGYSNLAINAVGNGLALAMRTANNLTSGYLNTTLKGTTSDASTEIPNLVIIILGVKRSTGTAYYGPQQISCAGMGASLSSAKRTILFNAIETCMDSLGKGVVE